MQPNQYLKDHPYNQFPVPFGANPFAQAIHPNFIGMDILDQQKALGRAQANIQASMQANTNIDSLLHVHRRKLQRRAANRKSAQLSRARKKAHLEELRIENARLQQMVDVLDSQPELIFCVNTRGDITYISERTINFVNVSSSTEDNEEDPTHISQILAKSSVDIVLKTIEEIVKISPPKSALAESSMLFASKEVEFQDAFGHPLVGSLRIARVNRRPSLDELSAEDAETAVAVALSSGAPLPPQLLPTSKKARTGKLSASSEAAQLEYDRLSTAVAFKKNQSNGGGGGPQLSNLGVEEWNLANFKMLTDCVSTLADHHDKRRRDDSAASDSSHGNSALGNSVHGGSISGSGCGSGSGSSASNAAYAQLQQQQHQQYHQMLNAAAGLQGSVDPQVGSASVVSGGSKEDLEVDSEFVCVIRTSDSYYARYSTRSDLFMFVSTPLSTATMEAHDQKPGNAIARHATLGGTGASYGKASSHGSSAGSVGVAQTNGNGVAGDEHRIASAVYRLVSSGSGSRSHDSSTLLPDSLSSGSGGISNSISSKSKDNTSSEEGSEDNTGGESSST